MVAAYDVIDIDGTGDGVDYADRQSDDDDLVPLLLDGLVERFLDFAWLSLRDDVIHAHSEKGSEFDEDIDAWDGLAEFPFGNAFVAETDLLGELLLRQVARLPQFLKVTSDDFPEFFHNAYFNARKEQIRMVS